MNPIFGTFKRETIRLTFRLLPTLGETPWMIGTPSPAHFPKPSGIVKHTQPPWFSKKAKASEALKGVMDAVNEKMVLGDLGLEAQFDAPLDPFNFLDI